MWDKVFGKKYDYYTTSLPISYVELKGHLTYYPKPDTIDPGEEYRGHTIVKEGTSYTIDGLSGVYPTLYDAVVSINTTVFTEVTGIEDKKLLAIYTDADSDTNGLLSWQEIRSFQMKINRTFQYIRNETALSPHRFLQEGGGDCEDWALFMAGLLRFWNYEAYIGSVNFKDKYHAITIVKVKELPCNSRGYRITRAVLESGELLPMGVYTYIDYYRVGRLTRASGRKPQLIRISSPEWYYGKKM